MSERHEFDIQDPFGTRPDEKPPQGWDEGFWEDVCARIEDHRSDPASSRPPEPPKRDGVPPRAVAIATIMMLMAAATDLLVIFLALEVLSLAVYVLTGLRRSSKPGRRLYVRKDGLPRVMGGLGTSIVSTSRGLMTDREAREAGLGGELLCQVW